MLHVSALAHCELLGYISRVLRRWGRRRGKKANNFMLYEPRVWAAREMLSRGLERRPKWKRKHRNVTHFGLLERCSLLRCAYALYSTLIARYAAVVMNGMKEDHDEWEKRGWRVETRSLSEWGLNSFTNYHDMSCYKHTKKNLFYADEPATWRMCRSQTTEDKSDSRWTAKKSLLFRLIGWEKFRNVKRRKKRAELNIINKLILIWFIKFINNRHSVRQCATCEWNWTHVETSFFYFSASSSALTWKNKFSLLTLEEFIVFSFNFRSFQLLFTHSSKYDREIEIEI